MNQHTEQELKALSNKVKGRRMRLRLLAVAHFKAGKNRAAVARMLNVSRRMVNHRGWPTILKVALARLKVKNLRVDLAD